MNDLRLAVRSLRATPIVTGVAVLSLALGIGASTAIFALTNGLLLRRLPVRDPGALVLGDAVYSSLREPPPPTVYFPLAQLLRVPPASLALTVRSETSSPLQLAKSMTAAIGTVDPDAALTFLPLTEQVSASVAQERILAMLSGFFGVFAVLLAGLGLFGVTSYSVSRRRREIGIRMALGAAPAGVVRLVLGRVCLMIAAGVAIGAAASLWTTRFTTSLLFGLEPRDPATFAGAAVVLVGAGLLAALPPAWRASRVDPSVTLRSE